MDDHLVAALEGCALADALLDSPAEDGAQSHQQPVDPDFSALLAGEPVRLRGLVGCRVGRGCRLL
jgi:hypothetical protein